MMDDKTPFQDLCHKHHLNEESITRLTTNGLTSATLLKLLRKEHFEQACDDWQLGQRLALESLVAVLKNENLQAQTATQPLLATDHFDPGFLASGNSVPGLGGPSQGPSCNQSGHVTNIAESFPQGHFMIPPAAGPASVIPGLTTGADFVMPSTVRRFPDPVFCNPRAADRGLNQDPAFSATRPHPFHLDNGHHHPASAPRPTIGSGHPVPDLATLLHLQRSRHQPPLHGQFPGLIDDPTIHLIPQNTIHKGETKPLLIVEYASDLGGPREASEQVLSEHDGQSIVVKSGSKKLKLDNISPAQWIGANARILAELLRQGRLQYHQVPQYLGYTAKIGDLALRYSWLSVLFYDNEYRYLQSQYQFDWGRDAPHLATTRLRERQTASSSSARPSKQGSPICRNYNSKGCTYSNCSFRHICSEAGCGKPHPKSGHTKDA